MILIVGGTGALGSATARRLLTRGQAVRIMTRTPQKAQDLGRLGAEIVRGDLRDQASLARACHGASAVLAAAHSVMGNGAESSRYVDDQGHRQLIDAAKSEGVKRFVYTSAEGVNPTSPSAFFRIKYAIEQYLRGSGLEFVILRPTAFMESHALMLIGEPILRQGKVTLFGKGQNPRNFVAADDVARYALIALEDPRTAGQTIAVGGPENWTNMQVVALYEGLAGRKAKVSHVPLGALRLMAPVLRPFKPGLSQVMEISILDDTSDCTFDMSETLQHYPMTLTRLEEWASENVPEETVLAGSPA